MISKNLNYLKNYKKKRDSLTQLEFLYSAIFFLDMCFW